MTGIRRVIEEKEFFKTTEELKEVLIAECDDVIRYCFATSMNCVYADQKSNDDLKNIGKLYSKLIEDIQALGKEKQNEETNSSK